MEADKAYRLFRPSRAAIRAILAAALVGLFAPVARAAPESVRIQSRTMLVGGERVHCLLAGSHDGLPVVLLHGGRYSAQTWVDTGTIESLASRGYRAVAVDLPGFGRTDRSTVEAGRWLGSFLDALKIDRPVIVTPSMSGRFALPYAIDHSKDIRGLVAVAPVGIKERERDLRRVTAPVLAIWGEKNGTIPLHHADLLVKQVVDGKRVVVPGAGHALYMDDIAAFHRELFAFLDRVGRTSSGG